MRILRNLPIRRKLTAITMLTSGLALVVACSSFIAFDYLAERQAFAGRVEAMSEIVSHQMTAAIAFTDAKAAEEVLKSLSSESHIRVACVYAQDGVLLASYLASPGVDPAPASPGPDRSEFLGGRLHVVHPVHLNGGRVGTVYLQSDLRDERARLMRNLAIGTGVLGLSLVIAFLLTSRLGGVITEPILGLAGTMRSVSALKDYSIRATAQGHDELGDLISGFNGMLSQIEDQNRELQDARADLERRVQERTAELVRLNEDLRREMSVRIRAEESLKEGEERYRSLVETSPDAIVIEFEGKFVFVNPAATALFGAPSRMDMIGYPVMERFPLEFKDRARKMLKLVRDGLKALPIEELRLSRFDGSTLDGEATCLPFMYKGKPAVQLVIRDITKRKELERMKVEFISTVSHELRSPLTSIRGSLKLIATGVTGPLAPKTRTLVDIANESCERLVHLVNDILDMEKLESGKLVFDLRPLDVVSVVEKAIESNRAYAHALGVTVTLERPAPSVRVLADSDRLIQILNNLISNASKFSPKDGIVSLRVAIKADKIRISVADRGSGIPDEFRTRIFQKFSQADSSDARSKQGTGLGLSIAKSIVERLGGILSFDSVVGAGSTFHVDLPRFRRPESGPQVAIPGRPRVLVCEDDASFSTVLRMTLDAAGMSVDIAATAQEALALLKVHAYAGMTLDLALPDRDGISLLRELRANPATQDLPVIIISAYLDEGRKMVGGDAVGIVDWLEKPVDDARLKTALHHALQKKGHRPRVLLVEDNAKDIEIVRGLLGVEVVTVAALTLEEARSRLSSEAFDLVIVDVGMPDGAGLELFSSLRRPDGSSVPVVVHSAQPVSSDTARLVNATLLKSTSSLEQLAGTVKFLLRPSSGPAPLPAVQGAPA